MRFVAWMLVGLPLLALVELGAHEYCKRRAPTDEDWDQLEPRVLAIYRPGDLVTVTPQWGEPLLRQKLGAAVFPLDLLGRPDNDGLRRAISVSFMGQKSNEFWSWDTQSSESVGPFVVSLLTNPNPEPATVRLIDRLTPPHLEVFDGPAGDQKPCAFLQHARVTTGGLGGNPTFPTARFQCPEGEPYLVAATTIDDEEFRPRRCIFAHPTPNGPLTLLFHQVLLGKKLVGHAGLPWLISRDGVGAPIDIVANVEGVRIGRHIVIDQEGYRRFEWSTKMLNNRLVDLELTISSENPENRRLCFTLESR